MGRGRERACLGLRAPQPRLRGVRVDSRESWALGTRTPPGGGWPRGRVHSRTRQAGGAQELARGNVWALGWGTSEVQGTARLLWPPAAAVCTGPVPTNELYSRGSWPQKFWPIYFLSIKCNANLTGNPHTRENGTL